MAEVPVRIEAVPGLPAPGGADRERLAEQPCGGQPEKPQGQAVIRTPVAEQ